MFVLKRQDVEIESIQHPKKDQRIPILTYKGMTFRLVNVFPAHQEEEARALWRELTDNQGKACVLLEEEKSYSIWGKVRLDELIDRMNNPTRRTPKQGVIPSAFIQAGLLMLQAMYIDVEDLLGAKPSTLFQRDLEDFFKQEQFPQTDTPDAVIQLLTYDPLNTLQPPPWSEEHLILLLKEVHRLGKNYFGGSSFVNRILDVLRGLPSYDREQFLEWLKQSSAGELWQ
jgi:hypothetical protein